MTKEMILAGVVGLVVGVLVAPLVMSWLPWTGQLLPYQTMMNGNQMMNANQAMGQIDAHFIEQMIPHHEDAITMANLALTRAEHPEIETLANNIIKSQAAEINQMKLWYKSWFGSEVANLSTAMGHGMGTMMHGGMMGDTTDLTALEDAESFDQAFIKEMIPHHQMAVMMAQMLAYSTTRPEMKQLAADIISAQSAEIDQMREWYAAWYGN